MSDQSRLFIAAVLMMGVLLISWFITGRNTQAPAGETIAEQVETMEPAGDTGTAAVTAPEEEEPAADSQMDYSYEEREVTVLIPGENGNPMVTAVLSTTGGSVVRWRLEEYEDYPDQDTGQRVELSEEPWLVTSDAQGDPVLFTYQGPDTVIAGETPVTVLMSATGGAEKVFEFTGGFYGFTMRKTGLDENTSISAGAIPVTETEAQDRGYFKASWYTNGHKSEDSEKIEALQPSGNVSWVATSSKYFTIILMPMSMERVDGYTAPGQGGSAEVSLDDSQVRVYAGPKAYGPLSELGGSQTDMIDFGWPIIRWIGKLIFFFLTSALSFIGNWGVRIIVLALALKILLSPLTTKSYVSMQKMQKIQPAMQEIQKKYAKDPKQQQVEMQKLYKESGVNPLGGCLPILLQMPVFFAMYRVLANMVELRGAGFFMWINDLSRPEILVPFGTKVLGLEGIGLMAVLIGVIMFMQQKLTGTSTAGAAAQQQKMMMYMMPFFMTFLFMRFAAGLALYWLVFNILTFIHQEYIKKSLLTE